MNKIAIFIQVFNEEFRSVPSEETKKRLRKKRK